VAKPTLGEIVHGLMGSSASHAERIENHRAAIGRIEAAHSKTAEALAETRRQLAVVKERLNELKKVYEEASRRNWLIVVAFVGSLLAFLGNLLLTFWRK
jgi:hypothetical protein